MNAGTAEKSTKTRNHADRSECPIAWALDVIGDRWTLLVIRDLMFMGKRQFGQFLESGERMPTNILADRLRRLASCGLISKTPYQTNPVRYQYELTEKGAGLRSTMETLGEWASGHLCSERGPAEDCR